jgi:multidrug resistance efflux pump
MQPEPLVTTQAGTLAPMFRTPPEELSAPVQELMGRTPAWLLRSGMTVIAGVTVLVLVLAAMIHYPDMIKGRVTVTGTNPPVAIIARQSGHLEQLCVREKQAVKKGGLLAVIRSPVDSASAFKIKEALESLQPFLRDPAAKISLALPESSSLGLLQAPYAEFSADWRQHTQLVADEFVARTVALLKNQLERKREQIEHMRAQVQNVERERELAKQRYTRLQQLQQRDSLSLADLQEAERALLEQGRQHSTVRGSFTEAEIAAADYEKQIAALEHTRREELRLSAMKVSGSAQKLSAAIDVWEADYVLRATVDGTVGFYDFWSDQQFVTAGKEVFIVAPAESPLLGRVPVQALGAGKIKPGQIVRIHFDDFPYKEFGIATGTVQNVSLVAQKGAHLVSIHLESPLITNYGRTLPFKQEMTGDASVIVEDRSLLGRIFSEVRDAFVNRSAR